MVIVDKLNKKIGYWDFVDLGVFLGHKEIIVNLNDFIKYRQNECNYLNIKNEVRLFRLIKTNIVA